MAVIYMKHPKHGTKVAIQEEEAKYDEKNGWERVKTVLASPSPVVVAAAVEPDNREKLEADYRARFGRKPHHKKSNETLKAELAAMGPFAHKA